MSEEGHARLEGEGRVAQEVHLELLADEPRLRKGVLGVVVKVLCELGFQTDLKWLQHKVTQTIFQHVFRVVHIGWFKEIFQADKKRRAKYSRQPAKF